MSRGIHQAKDDAHCCLLMMAAAGTLLILMMMRMMIHSDVDDVHACKYEVLDVYIRHNSNMLCHHEHAALLLLMVHLLMLQQTAVITCAHISIS